jgi:enamine deaminase RidA (YjgF/YER057c/UK114 family)
VLPAGGKIFISGQAEKGTDVASAVRLTMAGLHRSLAHVGLKKSDVVQVKAFIRPFADHAAARREVAASFDGGPVPPVVLIEWQSELFAEIELVASAPGMTAKAGETVAHSWLPWLTASPRYCNIAHVPAGVPLIFIGGLDGGTGDDRSQMKTIFERLGSVLFECGSSYRHLAKATYYLGGAPTRALLGDIRGVYFDPTRPPAASALQVAAFGQAGRKAEIEMIAVPVK